MAALVSYVVTIGVATYLKKGRRWLALGRSTTPSGPTIWTGPRMCTAGPASTA